MTNEVTRAGQAVASLDASARFAVTRRFLLKVNDLGIAITDAMVATGAGEWSSNVDLAALGAVAISGRLRPRDLLAPTGLTRGGLSNMLDRLESAQLVTRVYGDVTGDRRGAFVAITASGEALVTRLADATCRSLTEQQGTIADLVNALDALDVPRPTDPVSTPPPPLKVLALIGDIGTTIVDALAALDPGDPTPTKTLIVLSLASETGSVRPRDIIAPTGLTSGGVSQLLDRLQRNGLVRRRPGDLSDRRSVVVELTRGGERFHHQQLTAVGKVLNEIRHGIEGLDLRAKATLPSQRAS